jgi:hypothetical protein
MTRRRQEGIEREGMEREGINLKGLLFILA